MDEGECVDESECVRCRCFLRIQGVSLEFKVFPQNSVPNSFLSYATLAGDLVVQRLVQRLVYLVHNVLCTQDANYTTSCVPCTCSTFVLCRVFCTYLMYRLVLVGNCMYRYAPGVDKGSERLP